MVFYSSLNGILAFDINFVCLVPFVAAELPDNQPLSFRKIRLRREVTEARRRALGVHGRGGHQRPPEERLRGSISDQSLESPTAATDRPRTPLPPPPAPSTYLLLFIAARDFFTFSVCGSAGRAGFPLLCALNLPPSLPLHPATTECFLAGQRERTLTRWGDRGLCTYL